MCGLERRRRLKCKDSEANKSKNPIVLKHANGVWNTVVVSKTWVPTKAQMPSTKMSFHKTIPETRTGF